MAEAYKFDAGTYADLIKRRKEKSVEQSKESMRTIPKSSLDMMKKMPLERTKESVEADKKYLEDIKMHQGKRKSEAESRMQELAGETATSEDKIKKMKVRAKLMKALGK
jgi:hypothetical protein